HAALALLGLTIFLCNPLFAQSQQMVEPERLREAESFIEKAKEFKADAAEFHAYVLAQQAEAQKLEKQAFKLKAVSAKLNARIQKQDAVLSIGDYGKQYKAHLAEFQEHSRLYAAHLQEYEKQAARLQENAGDLQTSCKEYADHARKYHIPGLRPPHVCLQMQWQNQDMLKVARGYQEEQTKAAKVESKLAAEEAALAEALKERHTLENKLLQKADFEQFERTQGIMLLREYQQIEREYRNLLQEKKSVQLSK
ncbi:MAG: hypothetical protein K2X27_14010, partial [Candidatus Obscuribacterales bacterium]|nr:hypothetical protein [Candidatus Obscuribacterales bacterium]